VKPGIFKVVILLSVALLFLNSSTYVWGDKQVIVIDPGHGGLDRGAIGPTGLMEKEVVLDIAKRLKQYLEASRDLVVLLAREEDRSLSSTQRSGLANSKGADLFISLHVNASSSPEIEGFEIWHLSIPTTEESLIETDDDAKGILRDLKRQGIIEENLKLAELIRKNLIETGCKDQGIWGGKILSLTDLKMPALLVGVGFITNPLEEKKLKEIGFRDKIVKGLGEAILDFMIQGPKDEEEEE